MSILNSQFATATTDVEVLVRQNYVCQRVTDIASLRNLREAWNALGASRPSPFQQWQWLETWWECFGIGPNELCVLVVKDQYEKIVALLPTYITRTTFQGQQLRFLGSNNVCTDYNTLLVAPDLAEIATERIADFIASELSKVVDRVEFDSFESNDAAMAMLNSALVSKGFACERVSAASSWRIEFEPTWEQYMARLSRKRRWRARKIKKEYLETGRSQVYRAENDVSLKHGLEILVELHQDRRTSLGESGCFSSPDFLTFLGQAGALFFESGQLHLQWIELDGEPIAVEFDLLDADTFYHYQSGFATAASSHRPGWQGVMTAIERAHQSGAKYFDFLRGEEPYKKSWGAVEVPQEKTILFPPRLVPQLQHFVDSSLRRLKRLVR